MALLSAMLTGAALLAFGLCNWWLIRNIKIERIDNDIRANAERETSRTRSATEWQHIETEFVSNLGIRDSKDLILLVQNGTGEIIYQSSHWPASLDVARIPWPKRHAAQTISGLDKIRISEAHAAYDGTEPPGPPRPFDQAERGPDLKPERMPPGKAPLPGRPPPRYENAPEDTRQPDAERPPAGSPPVSEVISRVVAGHIWRIGLANADRSRIAVAVDTKVVDAEMKSIRNAFIIALPFALILTGLSGWAFSVRAIRPLKKLIATTHRVTTEGLNQQILVQGEDREFVELIDVFNLMLVKLKSNQAELERLALHDTLTGLPNRRLLVEHMQQALARAKRNSTRVAALFLDLDGFKLVNDTMGHKTGDEALKEITRRLLLTVRHSDTLSRLGGDEFVLLVTDVEESTESRVCSLAQKCIDYVAEPLCLQGANCNLGVSIGVAIRNGDCSPDQLLAAADKAMYEAKQKGRGCYVLAPCQIQ